MPYRLAFAIVLLTAATAAQQSQPRPKSSNQITATLTVHIFTDLEHQLGAALHSGDQGTIDRLLAPDFEVRRSSAPGVPVPRAEFISEQHPAAIQLSQMAVRLLGSTALVSFLASDGNATAFIVDTWIQDGSSWKLAARYESPAASSQSTPGGKRPTGRE